MPGLTQNKLKVVDLVAPLRIIEIDEKKAGAMRGDVVLEHLIGIRANGTQGIQASAIADEAHGRTDKVIDLELGTQAWVTL